MYIVCLCTIAKSVSLLDAMHYIKMSWDRITANMINNFFWACGFKSEEASKEMDVISVGEEEIDKDFLQYFEIDETILIFVELFGTEIVVQFSSSQDSSPPASVDEDSGVNEEPDTPPTTADARNALHTFGSIMENRSRESEIYDH